MNSRRIGYHPNMTIAIVLLLLAILFGVGAVLEGLFWAFVICGAFIAVGAWFTYRALRADHR